VRRASAVAAVVALIGLAGCSGSSSDLGGPVVHNSMAVTTRYPLKQIRRASLTVPVGATSINVAFSNADSDLIIASTPPGSQIGPVIQGVDTSSGVQGVNNAGGSSATATRLTLKLASISTNQAAESINSLTIMLNPKVVWTLALTGGASTERIDARGGHVTQVQLGHTSTATVLLPARAGTTTLDEVGGVSTLQVATPSNEVASVIAQAGAGTITIEGVKHSGIAAGTTVAQPGYPGAADRLDVQLEGGASSVTIGSGGASQVS
jgi:hypothetical protein